MEMIAAAPEWLVWCGAAGAIGVLALAVLVNVLEATLDLEAS